MKKPLKKFVLKITNEQYTKLVKRAHEETLKLGSYVSIAEIIRTLVDQFIDQVEIKKGEEK